MRALPRPRTLTVAALVGLAACGSPDRRSGPAEQSVRPSAAPSGPETIVLRLPRGGGAVRAYRWPALDTPIWSSADSAPPIASLLAFDAGAGGIAALDARNRLIRVDLRRGRVLPVRDVPLEGAVSADGSTVFGLDRRGFIVRVTPSGLAWQVQPPGRVTALVPQPSGAIVAMGEAPGGGVEVWRWRPPRTELEGRSAVPGGSALIASEVTDHLWVLTPGGLASRRLRDLSGSDAVSLDSRPSTAVTTPSGDRLFAASLDRPVVDVVDRYRGTVTGEIELPGAPLGLRMDPLGRFLLVRSATADTAWVVATADERRIGAVGSQWRDDLPAVAPDGSILTAVGADVIVRAGPGLAESTRIRGGASDIWLVVQWNGFRPRADGLDAPPAFAEMDSALDPIDSAIAGLMGDTLRDSLGGALRGPSPVPFEQEPPDTASRPAAPAGGGLVYYASFATMISESRAEALAASMRAAGLSPRVERFAGTRGPVYRVVIGPYPTRDEAERAGRTTGREFWIFESTP